MQIVLSIMWFFTVFAAFNCGVIGLFNFDLVTLVTNDPFTIRVIYTFFGVAAVWYLYEHFTDD